MALVSARCFACSIRQHPLARSGPYGYKIADFIMLALLVLLPLPVSGRTMRRWFFQVKSRLVFFLFCGPLLAHFSWHRLRGETIPHFYRHTAPQLCSLPVGLSLFQLCITSTQASGSR
uniref:(northern house mosquito) hypothetical protein n=1 Tax=Culex pipiens TaxID=7175 RepID=A0A8D8MMK6_CULPI